VVIGVPDGDLGHPPDPATVGVQIGRAEAGHQPDDGIAAAVQVRDDLLRADLGGSGLGGSGLGGSGLGVSLMPGA
jgi:hypothetical protein